MLPLAVAIVKSRRKKDNVLCCKPSFPQSADVLKGSRTTTRYTSIKSVLRFMDQSAIHFHFDKVLNGISTVKSRMFDLGLRTPPTSFLTRIPVVRSRGLQKFQSFFYRKIRLIFLFNTIYIVFFLVKHRKLFIQS